MSRWAILACGAKSLTLPGDAVVETGADGEEEIAILDGVVGVGGAVHAEHVERQLAVGVDRPDAHQRGDDGDSEALGERAQLRRGVAVDDAAAGVDQRTLGFAQQAVERLDLLVGDGRPVQRWRAVLRSRAAAASPLPWKTPSQFCTSFGMSTTTGPGRPLRAISKAVRMVASSFVSSVTRNTCLAHADMMLKTGASWKASVPMAARGTWPQISTIGTESA